MKLVAKTLTLSPTDLSAFAGCRHRTALDLAVASAALEPPEPRHDRVAELLRTHGDAHERAFVAALVAQGLHIVDLRSRFDATAATLKAMRAGAAAIVQGRLEHGAWGGYPDILRRVDTPSALGPWSYEPWDTKLARETRASTMLQLSAYADLLQHAQGRLPEHFHVVTPIAHEIHRVDDYGAYYRRLRDELERTVRQGADTLLQAHYPEPVETCEICKWWRRCNARRRQDDYLGFVAGMTALHRRELAARGFTTLAATAAMSVPLTFVPERGSRASYETLRGQAVLQMRRRESGVLATQLLPIEAGRGLCRLPQPDAGDLFLDLERARFARGDGLVYLFGLWALDGSYVAHWASTPDEERAAFEATVDRIADALARHPAMRVYHFGHFDADALKRLSGRHASRQEQVDALLRGERLIDLHAILRQSLRAGVESYSIKQLEPFYGFTREAALDDAADDLWSMELTLDAGADVPDVLRLAVEAYNRDDCRSAAVLREWLEQQRAVVEETTPVPRPPEMPADASPAVTELQQQINVLRDKLLDGVPTDAERRSRDEQARFQLAWTLDWHRREYRAEWWEFYRLAEASPDELLDERKAIGGLQFEGEVGKVKKSTIYRYRFPPQDVEIRPGDDLKSQSKTTVGTVDAIDRLARTVDIKQGPSKAALRPTAVFCHDPRDPAAMQQALLRLAGRFVAGEAAGCAVDLLRRDPPRLHDTAFAPLDGEDATDFAVRIATRLDRTVLPIQGPPGAGKTYTGARMICALLDAGCKVGVTAVSHKVIDNLLIAVLEEAKTTGTNVRAIHKHDPDELPDGVAAAKDNADVAARLADGSANLAGGTAWVWASEHCTSTVDVLVVDEAGQMSLANVLAAAQAADSLVLLGDPQQLDQPQKASHPEGTDRSALEHVLGEAKTMAPEQGIFLPRTWRLAPAICDFTSELFYERRLAPIGGLDRQTLSGTGAFAGAGLWFVPVAHAGNQNASDEEVDVVARLVDQLTAPGATWINRVGDVEALRPSHILVVAPYNAQVNRLSDRLASRSVRVGTVDKFQGQEAPVVIYSMATSSHEDAPRGMEFLYDRHRLNVATSRARAAAFIVASPRLLEPDCRTPRQMQLANALCRYRELAREVVVSDS